MEVDIRAERRPLIIVVDIDDDIGSTLGRSLIVGYDNVLDAATRFAIARPEDPDSNAMFVGLSIYRELSSSGKRPEIAVVGGHPTNSLLAQSLVKSRVQEVVSKNSGSYELYVVGDGIDEILMAQVLRDVAPIAGVRQVVVEQSLGIEGSYVLLARYIRKALNDPRYSKYFLGVPGVLLLVFGLLTVFGYLLLSLKVIAALLGVFMIIKGFGLEERAWSAGRSFAVRLRESSTLQLSGLGLLLATIVVSAYGMYDLLTSKIMITAKVGGMISYDFTTIIVGVIMYIIIADVFFKLSKRQLLLYKEAEYLVVLISLLIGFYYMGLTISSLPYPLAISGAYVYDVIIGSGFLLAVLLGAAIATIIEIVSRVVIRREQ